MKIRTYQAATKLANEINDYLYNILQDTKCHGISITYTVAISAKKWTWVETRVQSHNFCKWKTHEDVVKYEIELLQSLIQKRKEILPETIFQKIKRILTKTYTFRLK